MSLNRHSSLQNLRFTTHRHQVNSARPENFGQLQSRASDIGIKAGPSQYADSQNQNQRFGNYTVLAKLAEGGFGTIYRVRSQNDNNIYVMKEVEFTDNAQMEAALQEK